MKKKKYKSLPLTKQILAVAGNAILGTVNVFIELSPSRINRHIFGSKTSLTRPEPIQDWKIKRAIYELKKRHYIETKKYGNKIMCRLTKRGLTESVLSKIKTQTKLLSGGQMCIICF